MSDSAEGNVPRPKASASDPAQGSIEPEAADQFASAFVPAWQFDEAEFSAGAALSEGEIQGLAAVGDANGGTAVATGAVTEDVSAPIHAPISSSMPPSSGEPAIRGSTRRAVSERSDTAIAIDPFLPPKRTDTMRIEPSVVLADDLIREVATVPARRVLAPKVAPVIGPALVQDGEEVVVRARSKTRLLLGIGAAVTTLLGVLIFLLTRAQNPADPGPPAAIAPPARAAEDIPSIPPAPAPAPPAPASPPSVLPEATAAAVAAPPIAQASAIPTAKETSAPPAPAPPRPTTVAQPAHAQESTRQTRVPSKSPPKSSSGGIVRDNPF